MLVPSLVGEDCVFPPVKSLKVIGVTARAIAAHMVHLKAVRDVTPVCPVDEPMEHFRYSGLRLTGATPRLPEVSISIELVTQGDEAPELSLNEPQRSMLLISAFQPSLSRSCSLIQASPLCCSGRLHG